MKRRRGGGFAVLRESFQSQQLPPPTRTPWRLGRKQTAVAGDLRLGFHRPPAFLPGICLLRGLRRRRPLLRREFPSGEKLVRRYYPDRILEAKLEIAAVLRRWNGGYRAPSVFTAEGGGGRRSSRVETTVR